MAWNLGVVSNFCTKEFVVADALALAGDVAKSLVYSLSVTAVRIVGRTAVWWLAG